MNRLIAFTFVLVLAICLTGVTHAGTVLVVSDSFAPGDTSGTDHRDDSLVSFLEGIGYTVDTSGMGGAYKEGENPFDNPAALEAADLVIVTRRTNSGAYDNDRKEWNELETPLILMSGYLTRGESSSKRWGWATGASEDASSTETMVEVLGVPFPLAFFDWSGAPTPGECPKGLYLPKKDGSSEFSDDAIVVATFDGYDMMVLIPEGTDFDALNGTSDKYGVAGADRGFMGHWGYDLDEDLYGFDSFITDGYKDALEAMVAEVIPEPATIALLGLGGLALLRIRKRA